MSSPTLSYWHTGTVDFPAMAMVRYTAGAHLMLERSEFRACSLIWSMVEKGGRLEAA